MASPAPYSLRRRLLLWLLLPTVAIGLLALLDTYLEAVTTANAVSDRVLAGSALAIAERIVVAEDGSLEVDIPYVALEMLTSAAQDRVFYRVDGPPGSFITGYENLPIIPDLGDRTTTYADATYRNEPIRLAVLARSASTGINSVPFVVTIAETTIARSQLAQTILLRSAIRLGVLILSAAAIVWFAVTVSLRPLDRLREAIAERSPDDLHPIEQTVPAEVRGLVDNVNSFMARLGTSLDALRHFTGNASHQLRTPLTIIRTQLALSARAQTLDEARHAAATGDQALAHAERVLAQLLLLAKINETGSDTASHFIPLDLTDLARTITADHIPRARAAGIDLGFEGEIPALIHAEPLLLGELLGNLIDNTIAYAGPGTEATVRVLPGDQIILEVEDNGQGIPPEKLPQIRQRFTRGTQGQGAGLGLPIVEEIAALFGGELELATSPGGKGLRVRVAFPLTTQ